MSRDMADQDKICKRYAPEAIIKFIIFLVINVYTLCYDCDGSRVCNNHEALRETHVHV